MKGLDTNILIRFIVRDDEIQAAAADACLNGTCSRDDPCLINRIVLCELVWMLDRGYRYPRELIAGVIEKILRTEEFVAENAAETWAALGKYRQGRADFADCLIGTTNKALGCSETATFDRIASRMEEFTLVRTTEV